MDEPTSTWQHEGFTTAPAIPNAPATPFVIVANDEQVGSSQVQWVYQEGFSYAKKNGHMAMV